MIARASQSSVVLARLRVLPRTSRLCRAVAAFDRACHRAIANRFRLDIPVAAVDGDTVDRLAAVMSGSRLMAFARRCLGLDAPLARSSWVEARWTTTVDTVQRLESWQRVRLAGGVLLVATATDISIRMFGDVGWRPATIGFWVAGLGTGAVLIVGCRQVAAAWAASRVASRRTWSS